jgi:hypothetical protein
VIIFLFMLGNCFIVRVSKAFKKNVQLNTVVTKNCLLACIWVCSLIHP